MSGSEALLRAMVAAPPKARDPLCAWPILGMRVDGTDYSDATARVLDWAEGKSARAVFIANVHMVMEAYDRPEFKHVVNAGDLVTPDGMPLVWMLRLLGAQDQERVYGPDLMLYLCAAAARSGLKIGLFGSRPETLDRLAANLKTAFPGLRIAYQHAPPFRPLTPVENDQIAQEVLARGVRILFVGLGCPKQELWIAQNLRRFQCPLVGVGAAFDFHAGVTRQAPTILQKLGLEWAFRLGMEPKRLWRRYARHNPRFVFFAVRQILAARLSRGVMLR